MADQDLPELLSDLEFEVMTRAERFSRIGGAGADDPVDDAELLEPLEGAGEAGLVGTVGKIVDILGNATATNHQMFLEVAKSIGFDLRVLKTLTEHVAEQQREIELLRRAVEDLRRNR